MRPDDAGGRLRTQCELAYAAVLEAVELLGDGVGVLADTLDQLRVLDQGRHDLLVSVSAGHVRGGQLGGAPQRTVAGKDVANAADSLDRLGAWHWVEF